MAAPLFVARLLSVGSHSRLLSTCPSNWFLAKSASRVSSMVVLYVERRRAHASLAFVLRPSESLSNAARQIKTGR
ncbi:hypothetical protein C8R45DRAFT_968375 [Mycena sanguinolenta]|nr:hypothetical protein C8R45DRAFT_968375 [Mycena sanguinolenta]